MAKTVTIRSGDDWENLRARVKDTATLGRIIGRILESQSQRAFLEQRLGDLQWPERYPSQDDPFVNVAALVNWTNSGGTVLPRFFDRRPALMGEGTLSKSIAARTSGKVVEVGSALSYAGLHQWGGSSSQPITQGAKKTIGAFIGEEEKGGVFKRKARLGSRQKANREKYFFKLYPLLSRDELTTEVNQRPFLGITEENERDMVEDIEEWVAMGDE